ncbi:MAG: PilT/PilU family type 4a pilus ATPase [Deltaproteobacteria bacterium]|nr:PilT/PilU family type 4a pilus ATPase [Deltaproteobacteria bacterium]MDZ4341059.1 PilT/PilU family type 4a pilus ATPase [Candidatus Binatia bacterium]
MDIQEYFKVMVDKEASDLYLTVARPPMYRIGGKIQPIGDQSFTAADLQGLAYSIMNEWQTIEFKEKMEMNLALPGVSRFRVNIFRQRGSTGMAIRRVKVDPESLDDLGLPAVLKELAMTKRGLVLVVGATGSGKSTTLAAMVDYRNTTEYDHIITIEDPIEFVHKHKNSIITQREIGFDTHSYQAALKNTLRQAPDVILIGEIRDTETMEAALTFAETGHLCLSTLHSNNANQAIERIMNFFPPARHVQIYLQLSLNLRAIISQRLIPSLDSGRVAAMEILMDTPRIKDLIKKGEVDILKEGMEQGVQEGCQTFDDALFMLYKERRISFDQAMINSDSANNLRLRIKLAGLKVDDEPQEVQSVKTAAGQPKTIGVSDPGVFRLRGN